MGLKTEVPCRRAVLAIETRKTIALLDVEIADTIPAQEQGLMFRRVLGKREGMLFLFDQESTIDMWMKNTLLALDMIFISVDWRILHIVRDNPPLCTTPVTSVYPCAAVLEIRAGQAAELHLEPGLLASLQH